MFTRTTLENGLRNAGRQAARLKQLARQRIPARLRSQAIAFTLILLTIEFFDELHYGITGAILPALRTDLGLSYAQIGMLLGIPGVISNFIEPGLMLLGDTRLRKHLVVGGGLVISLSLLLLAGSSGFIPVVLAFILSYPASGAFVTLAQATLMDLNPGREPQMMARWTVFGSFGNLAGPLLVSAGFFLGWGWRWIFLALTGLVLALVALVVTQRFPTHPHHEEKISLKSMADNVRVVLRQDGLMRWLILLDTSDLLLDVFTGYLALYFTDVVGATNAQAGLILGGLMLVGLLADIVLIPLLEKVQGRTLMRVSAVVALVLYTAWLVLPWPAAKVILLVPIRLATSSWYPVLVGEAYAAAPGRSGTLSAVSAFTGLLGGAFTWLVGWAAGEAGLQSAMWLLLLAPISLALFVPPARREA